MPVNDSDDDDGLGHHTVEDPVREALHDHAPQVPVHDLRCKRSRPDAPDGLIQRGTEDLAKTTPLLLVPAEGFEDVLSRLGEEDDAAHGSPVVISA